MTKLPKALHAWNTDMFDLSLRDELQELSTGTLPLVQATTQGGHIDDRHMTIIFLHATDVGVAIQATPGIFFTEIVVSSASNCDFGTGLPNRYSRGVASVPVDVQALLAGHTARHPDACPR